MDPRWSAIIGLTLTTSGNICLNNTLSPTLTFLIEKKGHALRVPFLEGVQLPVMHFLGICKPLLHWVYEQFYQPLETASWVPLDVNYEWNGASGKLKCRCSMLTFPRGEARDEKVFEQGWVGGAENCCCHACSCKLFCLCGSKVCI